MCLVAIRKVEQLIAKRRDEPARKRKNKETPSDNKPDSSKEPAANSGTFLETFVSSIVIGDCTVSVRGLSDGGSNASYIHVDVLKKLKIRLSRDVNLLVQSYGSNYLAHTTASRSTMHY